MRTSRVNGHRQREKGAQFERAVAKRLREMFPEFASDIRRSDQGFGAKTSDVTGLPGFWFECQNSVNPTPLAKLAQALRDCAGEEPCFPIAVTRREGARTVQATMRGGDFCRLMAHAGGGWHPPPPEPFSLRPVTLDFEDLIHIIFAARPWNP